jgi:hypothetical protein
VILLDIKKILIKYALIKETDLIDISLFNNDGARNPSNNVIRYFVYVNNEPKFSIKQILKSSIYKIDSILSFYKLFENNHLFSLPKLYQLHEDDSQYYFIEEYVQGKNLLTSVLEGRFTQEEAIEIVEKVLFEIHSNQIMISNQSNLTKEMDEFKRICDILPVNDNDKEILKKYITKILNKYSGKNVNFTRDIHAGNIIYYKGKITLVDFDLCTHSSFGWIDIIRSNDLLFQQFNIKNCLFRKNKNPYNLDLSDSNLWLIHYLNEINIQNKILNQSNYDQLSGNLYMKLYDTLSTIPELNQIKIKNRRSINNQDIDGKYYFQVFYDQGLGFTEENSTKFFVSPEKDIELSIDLKDYSNFKNIRLDLLNARALIFIESIEVISFKDKTEKRQNVLDHITLLNDLILLEKDHQLLSLGEDPQIGLDLLEIESNSSIRIKYKFCMDYEIDLDDYLLKSRQKINSLESELQNLKASLTWRMTTPLRWLKNRNFN